MKYNIRRLSYPTNFIVDMFNQSTKCILEICRNRIVYPRNIDNITLYREDGVNFILSCLSEDDRKLIHLKYNERRNTTYIARQFNTNTHEIESRVQRIRNRLSHPSRFLYLKYDISEEGLPEVLSFDEEEFKMIHKDDFVDSLNLTDRTSNALYRNNIYLIKDLLKVLDNSKRIVWYDGLRNVGRESAKEIINELSRLKFIS